MEVWLTGSMTSDQPGTIPVSGDWNNNGMTEIGVFRPSTHMFYLDINGNGVWNGALVDKAYTSDGPMTTRWPASGVNNLTIFFS